MIDILKLHNQGLVDVMAELDRSNDPRTRVLHHLAETGHVYPLDENQLGPLRKASTVFPRSEWLSPILDDKLPFEKLLNTKQMRGVIANEIGGENTYFFAPSRGSPELNAQAIVELLNNIHDPYYSKPGAILRMHSPTFERLCQYKADWQNDGMLGVSAATVAVTPADDIQDMEYYDNYTLNTLLTGTKVWFAYPPLPGNFHALQTEYDSMSRDNTRFATNNPHNFQHGIAIVQQAGQTLVLPPFWIAASVTTQTSVSCAYHIATAMAFAERIKFLENFLVTIHLWPLGDPEGQRRLLVFATEFIEHLNDVFADSFAHYSASKVIIEICRQYELLRTGLRRVFDAIEDKAIVRGLENNYRAVWLKFLEQKRKKTPACRLCHVRIQNMPGGSSPTDRLRQHFVDFHCVRSGHT
ncbi:hypothetical protein N0V94_003674 [Neodidymelliopsis sp. IMI 364377]|nr:hypothetical protein N0V94_003674 [Neodidymelliopsis sp. IMI 364377]